MCVFSKILSQLYKLISPIIELSLEHGQLALLYCLFDAVFGGGFSVYCRTSELFQLCVCPSFAVAAGMRSFPPVMLSQASGGSQLRFP